MPVPVCVRVDGKGSKNMQKIPIIDHRRETRRKDSVISLFDVNTCCNTIVRIGDSKFGVKEAVQAGRKTFENL